MNHEIPENHEKVRCPGGGGFSRRFLVWLNIISGGISHSPTFMTKPVAFFRVGGASLLAIFVGLRFGTGSEQGCSRYFGWSVAGRDERPRSSATD